MLCRAVLQSSPQQHSNLVPIAIRVDQPDLLHDLAAATDHDGTTARKLLNSKNLSIARIRRQQDFVRTLVAFRDLHGLTQPQLVSLCGRNSVACRLGRPEFVDAVEALRDGYGMDTKQLVTFMRDGVAARLGQLEFDDAVKALRDKYGMSTQHLAMLMCDGVASRLQDKQFQNAMRKVIDCTGMPCAVSLFNRGSFSCHIKVTHYNRHLKREKSSPSRPIRPSGAKLFMDFGS